MNINIIRLVILIPVIELLVLLWIKGKHAELSELSRYAGEASPIIVPVALPVDAPGQPAALPEPEQSVETPVQPVAAIEPMIAVAPATPADTILSSGQEPPQGSPVLEVPLDQVLDDPRAFGGVIIPRSNIGTYVPGLQAEIAISSSDQSGRLTPGQTGAFPTIVIIPNGKAEITLSYPELGQGAEVKLYCPDGGTIDGETSSTRVLGGSGALTFEWQGNDNLGRHTIYCIAGPEEDEKVISFWVGPRAYADASSVPRT